MPEAVAARRPGVPYPFEKLEVWRLALALVGNVYDLCRQLPRSETYALGDQLRRASVSVALNIAEGRAGDTDAEFRRYLGISLKSLVEVVACIKVAQSLRLVAAREAARLCECCDALEAKLRRFRQTLKRGGGE